MATPHTRERARAAAPMLALVALAALVAVTFAPVTHNAPVWDDDMLVVSNPYLRSWSGFQTLVTTDIWRASAKHEPSSFYRPLTMVSYLLDARLFGQTSVVFHVVNALLHFGNAALLFFFLRARGLARGVLLPAIVAASFAVAPINVEPVTWIAGRFDLLGTLFVLGALAVNGVGRRWSGGFTVALLACALLCKESFALGLLLVVFDDVLVRRRPPREGVAKYVGFVLAFAAFLIARRLVGVASLEALSKTGAPTLLASLVFLITTYVPALIYPTLLDPFRPYVAPSVVVTLVVLVLATLLALGAYRLWRARPSEPRAGGVAMGYGWLVAAFAPATLTGPNLLMVGDRYAYFPLIGVFVAACAGMSLLGDAIAARAEATPGAGASAKEKHRALLALLGVVAAAFVALNVVESRERLRDWVDDRTLFEASVRDAPDNAYALYSVGYLDALEGDFEHADEALARSLAIQPTSWRTLDAVCFVRLHQKRLRDAERACQASLSHNDSNPRAWVNLASVYVNASDWGRCDDAASRAIAIKREAAEPFYLRAVCRANLGDVPRARDDLAAALANEPAHPGALGLVSQFRERGLLLARSSRSRRRRPAPRHAAMGRPPRRAARRC